MKRAHICLRGNLEIESLIDQYVAQMVENPHVEGSKRLQSCFRLLCMWLGSDFGLFFVIICPSSQMQVKKISCSNIPALNT
jgi:hypothetical protein